MRWLNRWIKAAFSPLLSALLELDYTLSQGVSALQGIERRICEVESHLTETLVSVDVWKDTEDPERPRRLVSDHRRMRIGDRWDCALMMFDSHKVYSIVITSHGSQQAVVKDVHFGGQAALVDGVGLLTPVVLFDGRTWHANHPLNIEITLPERRPNDRNRA